MTSMLIVHDLFSLFTRPLEVVLPKLNAVWGSEDLNADSTCSAFGPHTALRSVVTKT